MRPRHVVCLLLLIWIWTGGIHAQPAEPPVDPRFQEILANVEQGDLRSALSLLKELSLEQELPPQLQAMKGALQVETGDPAAGLETLRPLTTGEDADPAVLYNAGRAAVAVGEIQLAESLLSRSVEQVPGSPAARELGMLWARSGRYRDAYRLLRPWATTQPEDSEARLVAALCAVQIKRPSEAENLLSDLDQSNPQVRLLWGKLLLDKADPHGSIATLKPLVDKPPAELELDARRTLAEAQAAIGQASEAVKLLEGRVGDNPSVALQLAQAQYQSGDLEHATMTLKPFAEPALQRLLQADLPAEQRRVALGLTIEYGRFLATSGRHEEAIPYLEAATDLAPENKQSWQQLGQAYAAAGRREEAQIALERFQEIVETEAPSSVKDLQMEADLNDPTSRELREASKVFDDGRVDEALRMLQAEAELAPGDPRPLLLAARFLLVAERADEALSVANQAIEMAPTNADGYYIKGTILMGMRHFPEAETEYLHALELSPEHTATMNDLAVLLMEQGRNEEARDLLEIALEIRPEDELAAENLKRLGQP